MKKFLLKTASIWAVITAIAYVLFPVLAPVLTFGANFYSMIFTKDGTIRAYYSLGPGVPLYHDPYEGNTPAWVTTGELIAVQRKYMMPGSAYSNPEMYWRDFDSYHKICFQIGTSPADAVAFWNHGGCFWLRNRNGEQYEQIITVKALRGEWNRLLDLGAKPMEVAWSYPDVGTVLETVLPVSIFALVAVMVLMALTSMRRRLRYS